MYFSCNLLITLVNYTRYSELNFMVNTSFWGNLGSLILQCTNSEYPLQSGSFGWTGSDYARFISNAAWNLLIDKLYHHCLIIAPAKRVATKSWSAHSYCRDVVVAFTHISHASFSQTSNYFDHALQKTHNRPSHTKNEKHIGQVLADNWDQKKQKNCDLRQNSSSRNEDTQNQPANPQREEKRRGHEKRTRQKQA